MCLMVVIQIPEFGHNRKQLQRQTDRQRGREGDRWGEDTKDACVEKG